MLIFKFPVILLFIYAGNAYGQLSQDPCASLVDIDWVHCNELNRAHRDIEARERELQQANKAKQTQYRAGLGSRRPSMIVKPSIRQGTRLGKRPQNQGRSKIARTRHINGKKLQQQRNNYRERERRRPVHTESVRQTKLYKRMYGDETVTE